MTGAMFELIGGLLFCLFAANFTSIEIIIFYTITMLGTGLIMGNTMTASLNVLSEKENTDGNGLFNMAQQFAGAVGTAIVSAIMQFVQQMSGKNTAAGKLVDASQVGLIFLLVLVVVGVYLLYKATKPVKAKE